MGLHLLAVFRDVENLGSRWVVAASQHTGEPVCCAHADGARVLVDDRQWRPDVCGPGELVERDQRDVVGDAPPRLAQRVERAVKQGVVADDEGEVVWIGGQVGREDRAGGVGIVLGLKHGQLRTGPGGRGA